MTRLILWMLLIASIMVFQFYAQRFREAGVSSMYCFEVASQNDAEKILTGWKEADLEQTAKGIIRFDFFFIPLYLLLMIGCSNDQMAIEKNKLLNRILQMSIFLAVIAAGLDVWENLIFLRNLREFPEHTSSVFVTFIKFLLAYWVVGIWLLSRLRSIIVSLIPVKALRTP